MNRIVKVIFPIALEKEFDYLLSPGVVAKKGMRVLINFGRRRALGIVVGIMKESPIKGLKSILNVLDSTPCLTEENIRFARILSKIYPYAYGEFLFMMLPSYLRRERRLDLEKIRLEKGKSYSTLFIKANSFPQRYSLWKEKVKEKLKQGSVLIIFPQNSYLNEARQILERDFPHQIKIIHSQKKGKELLTVWKDTRHNSLILGTRVAIFYYPWDLKLIVVEEENSPFYFQEEKPFHHLLDVTLCLSRLKKIDLILSADYPALSTYKLIKEGKIHLAPQEATTVNSASSKRGGIKPSSGVHREDKDNDDRKIRVVDMTDFRKGRVISPVLRELLRKNVAEAKRVVILWNRKGYARLISCLRCGYIFKCDRCLAFLKFTPLKKATDEIEQNSLTGFTLKQNKGICPYCGKDKDIPFLCPNCQGGYLKPQGLGIERIEVILKRIFPEIKMDKWEERKPDSQIILSTSKILSSLYAPESFDIGFLLDVDSYLSCFDYEAGFDAFLYIKKLSLFFKDTLYVFTRNRNHHIFSNLQNWEDFYSQELSLRKKLSLPPFGFLAKIILRAKDENKLLNRIERLYNKLKERGLEVYGPLREWPFKLRDKFRYSVMVKSKRNSFLRKIIKEEVSCLRSSHLRVAIIIK